MRPGSPAAVGLTALVVVVLGAVTVFSFRESSSSEAVARPAASGADLFFQKGCGGCHSGPDHQSRVDIGPDLRALPAVAAVRRPGLSAEAYVRQSLLTPGAYIVPGFSTGGPGSAMPVLPLSTAEVDTLIAYLLTPL